MSATVSHPARRRATLLAKAPESVNAERVSKNFRVPHVRYSTLKERALHPFAARTADEFEALRDVSFAVKRGEFFGIVGRNGSGKSTLLKCVAGIYAIDCGLHHGERPAVALHRARRGLQSRALGSGQRADQRDHARAYAASEARARFDEIIEFAELEEFVDLKLKNYSSGMSVRLGFAVAIQVEADVLLVDEVLAVGDAAFQQKCFDEFDRLKSENRTMLYVTHDMASVERFCDHGLVLERGRLVDEGEPERITRTYNEINFGQMSGGEAAGGGRQRRALRARLVRIRVGRAARELSSGRRDPCLLRGRVHARRSRTRS